jgi:CheY-like chemotaxis protein
MHVILMGPQGSGKGTQSERVRARLNLGSIATGELFREAIKSGTALGQQIQAVYDRGELVPDGLTVALVEERLDQLAGARARGSGIDGALYDGFPRTLAQADALNRVLQARGEDLTSVVVIDAHELPGLLLSGRSRMSNARILVVDDDQVIQQLLKVNLELEGYAVEVASDGEEALVMFDRFRPDLVLLDIMMPKLDGWEVARRLAKTTGGPVPIVLLSARAQESDVQKGNDLGVAAYVTKPFDPIQLLHLVAGIIAQQDRGAATPGVS